MREQAAPGDPAALLRTLSALADVWGQVGDHDGAAPLHERAAAMLERSEPQSAAQAEALAGHLNELGLWHLQHREYDGAGRLLQRSLAIVQARDAGSLETTRAATTRRPRRCTAARWRSTRPTAKRPRRCWARPRG
ncbi:tetratricopeptide repeat protein [Xylophilus sp.]|uniref:tetratricopeptide repeat protein n=1 Tax=Xylophilus sp. TaxID=2653893 RepID=UPI0013BAD623|nr:tetratricopeptide repeat protein [Xylophilus sp.]KAF1047396.1 MAG: hypothetical protein GAK38_01915 [Xylophilus sp.]